MNHLSQGSNKKDIFLVQSVYQFSTRHWIDTNTSQNSLENIIVSSPLDVIEMILSML